MLALVGGHTRAAHNIDLGPTSYQGASMKLREPAMSQGVSDNSESQL